MQIIKTSYMKYGVFVILNLILLTGCTTVEVISPESSNQRVAVNIPEYMHGTFLITSRTPSPFENCYGYNDVNFYGNEEITINANSIVSVRLDSNTLIEDANLLSEQFEPEELTDLHYPSEYSIRLNNFGGEVLKIQIRGKSPSLGGGISALFITNMNSIEDGDSDSGCLWAYLF